MAEARLQGDPAIRDKETRLRLVSADGPSPDPARRPCILLDRVSLRFQGERTAVQALSDISLSVAEGEFVALLGPTGCGKSSLLRLVSDLLPPTSGRIEVRGEPASAARRVNQFGFVFQEPALLSWRTAIDNVRLPLEVVGYPATQRIARCEELLQSVGLLKFKDSYPHELSGGMKQRVALARALAPDPEVLLMDEPFAALDAMTRDQLYGDIQRIWAESRKTILFVTHDVREAVCLGDRVLLMSPRPGHIGREFKIPLARPRDINSPALAELAAQTAAALKEAGTTSSLLQEAGAAAS